MNRSLINREANIFINKQKPHAMTAVIVIVILYLSGCTTSTPSVPQTRQVAVTSLNVPGPTTVAGLPLSGAKIPHDVYHVVGPSETLWRISKTYDVDMKTLMAVNRISDATRLHSGQKLLIPNTKGAKPIIPLYPNKRWTHIVIHHTATDDGNAFKIDQLHHKRGFWNGLGYHFLIDNGTNGTEDGQIEVGPRWIKQMEGAHCNVNGMNEHGIGIAIVGNYSENYLTYAELYSLVFLVKTLQAYYHIPSYHVLGHRDVPGKATECPGKLFPWHRFKAMLD